MPNISAPALSFPNKAFPAQQSGAPTGIIGDLLFSEVMPKYATLAKSQKVFYVSATVTAPVIFSTAAQLGPMLWNRPGSGVDAHLLAVCLSSPTTAATVAGAIGWASNAQTTAPTTPGTALVAVNAYAGGGASQMGFIGSTGTVLILPVPIFMPLIAVNTGAVSVNGISQNWLDVGGALIVGPGTVGYICGSATLSTMVLQVGIVWAELPA
jgi:hypothetical protein